MGGGEERALSTTKCVPELLGVGFEVAHRVVGDGREGGNCLTLPPSRVDNHHGTPCVNPSAESSQSS